MPYARHLSKIIPKALPTSGSSLDPDPDPELDNYFICVVDKSSLNLVQKVTINFIISSELLESLLTKMNG